jgi:hypothetical protein
VIVLGLCGAGIYGAYLRLVMKLSLRDVIPSRKTEIERQSETDATEEQPSRQDQTSGVPGKEGG